MTSNRDNTGAKQSCETVARLAVAGWLVFALASTGAVLAAESKGELATGETWSELFALKAQRPAGMAYDGSRLWLIDRSVPELVALDPATGEIRDRIAAPGPWPEGLAWDGTRLWIADSEEKKIYGIDPRTKLVDTRFDSPVDTPQGLAWDGKYLWLADGRELHRISRNDGTTIASLPAPSSGGDRGTEMLGLTWQPPERDGDRGWLWVVDRHKDKVYRVAAEDGAVIDAFPAFGPYAVGASFVGGRLYVADRDLRKVHTISVQSLPRIARTDPRRESVVFAHELVNFGPGTVKSADVFIAIPKKRANQTFENDPEFDPMPTEIVVDRWGQRVARFHGADVAPGGRLRAQVKVRLTTWAVRWHVDPNRVGELSDVPSEIMSRYTANGAKLMIEDPVIDTATRAAVGNERNPYFAVRKIARHIQDHMTYELSGGWEVAPAVLARGTGSCSEYTFVFLAMCHAAGIPARYAGAVVVRGDDASSDRVFHRWPEVYYPNYGWIPADVQAGDSPSPEKQSEAMTALPNRFLITTEGAGGSEYLDWTYNSNARWTCEGYCKTVERVWGDWSPDRSVAGVVSIAAGE